MSSSPDHEKRRETPETRPGQSPPSPPRSLVDTTLLDKVLRHTSAVASDDPVDSAEMEALHKVVERHRGKPLVVEPIARELIQAVLLTQLPARRNTPELRQDVAALIAQTLMGDPVASERLTALWNRLCEGKT